MKSVIHAVLSSALVLASSSAHKEADIDDHGENAVAMTAASFKEFVSSAPHFVMFFAPWCGHCKRLAPAWNDLAERYNEELEEQEVVVAKVDCTVETELCSTQDVTGYPTLKFYKDGVDSGNKYRGQRDLRSLAKFVEEQLGRVVADDEQEEELAKVPEEAGVENDVYILDEKSFKKHVTKGDTFVKFYAPWCGHCQKLAPTWDDLAKAVGADSAIEATIAKVDCTKAQSVCEDNGVKGYPTLVYFRQGEKVETYSGARTLKELLDFVSSMSNVGAVRSEYREPTEDAREHVVNVKDSDVFEETIRSDLAFIKFYAPWCGHCKRLAPTWEQLATKYSTDEKVTIAKLDCTSDDNKNKEVCNDQGVNGFPTLNLYRNGKKVEEYGGKRSLEELQAFVEKHLGHKKDEL